MQEDPRPVKCEWGWLRPHSTPATLLWLQQNYEVAEGVCIPRNTLYLHYVDFCARNSMQPVNAASFGKIIRQQFPQLTTRRLGTRGQSRYHYYGIAVRLGSLYFEPPYAKGADAGHRRQPPQCAPSRLLPEFPRVRQLMLPAGTDADQLAGFVAMYRGHCQRLLDECAQEPPRWHAPVRGALLAPCARPPGPPLLASNSLANLALERRLSLAKLWPAWRATVPDCAQLDLASVSTEAAAHSPRPGTPSARFVYARVHELCALLGSDEQALFGWLEALVERSVASPSAASAACAAGPMARHFLAVWCAAGAEAERQLPVLRPLRALLDEWVRMLLERLLADALLRQLLDNVANDAPPEAWCVIGPESLLRFRCYN
ncbi:hypothetical protein MRX96_018422 [Rhipicephalus microplus]